MTRMSEARMRCAIVALREDAAELIADAKVFLQRAPRERAVAERTGDLEFAIAAELEASLADRADAAREGEHET